MEALLLSVVLGCLLHSSYHNPQFDAAFSSSKDAFLSAFRSAGFVFCSGLDVILSAQPPSLAWFESVGFSIVRDRRQIPFKCWGIYVHVFIKPGFPTLIYVGSATASDYGLRSRFKDYRLLHAVSQSILDAINDGYTLDHSIILAYCPIPKPVDRPLIRAVCLAFEAGFSAIFWCMRSTTRNYGHLGANSIWNRDELPWGGLCTHSPLVEGCDGLDLTPEELDAVAEGRRIRKNQITRDWVKANNAKNRVNPPHTRVCCSAYQDQQG